METLERSRVCRLCGKQAGMTIDIFGKRGHHVKKINMVLPILVHEMDLLPKHMCHPCNYKLEEFHKFYLDCLKTDAHLKSQLSWMQGPEKREEIIVPMVQINNVKIKTEPLEYEEQAITETAVLTRESLTSYENDRRYATLASDNFVRISGARCTRCGCYCGKRNYAGNDNVPRMSCPRTKNRESANKSVADAFPSRDLIRRNLFATEIFGNKNPTVQTEVPSLCDEKFYEDQERSHGVRSLAGLDRLSAQQQNVPLESMPNIGATDASPKVPPRVLRPRKRVVASVPRKKTGRRIVSECGGGGGGSLVKVKMEAPDESERSLRPRTEAIDYSESKRKNDPVRPHENEKRVKRIKATPEAFVKMENVKKELADDPMDLVKPITVQSPVPSSILVWKVEPEDSSGFARNQTIYSNTKKAVPTTTFEVGYNGGKNAHIVKSEPIRASDKVRSRKNVKSSGGCKTSVKSSKAMASAKRKNSPKKYRKSSTHCLRSQMGGYLKNDKSKRFNFIAHGPSSPLLKQSMPRLTLTAIRDRQTWLNTSTIMKYQDCDTCKQRFASQELYRLHACYNNKRH